MQPIYIMSRNLTENFKLTMKLSSVRNSEYEPEIKILSFL